MTSSPSLSWPKYAEASSFNAITRSANLQRRAKQRQPVLTVRALPAASIGLAVSTKACILYQHKTAPPRTETLQKGTHSIHMPAAVSYSRALAGASFGPIFCLLSMPFAEKRILRSLDARDLEAEKAP